MVNGFQGAVDFEDPNHDHAIEYSSENEQVQSDHANAKNISETPKAFPGLCQVCLAAVPYLADLLNDTTITIEQVSLF
uniref:Uncharacterized protein n=1 Tax=Panagrolaimus davidi TaxID=227884 RepID=A0A914PGQ3_9BILA